jgi:hypothetical protein
MYCMHLAGFYEDMSPWIVVAVHWTIMSTSILEQEQNYIRNKQA